MLTTHKKHLLAKKFPDKNVTEENMYCQGGRNVSELEQVTIKVAKKVTLKYFAKSSLAQNFAKFCTMLLSEICAGIETG